MKLRERKRETETGKQVGKQTGGQRQMYRVTDIHVGDSSIPVLLHGLFVFLLLSSLLFYVAEIFDQSFPLK